MRWMEIVWQPEAHEKASEILSEVEIWALEEAVALHPELGKIIPQSGGIRKLRVAAKGHGKRGGARVIYYWYVRPEKVVLLDFYPKNEKEDLTRNEIKKLKEML